MTPFAEQSAAPAPLEGGAGSDGLSPAPTGGQDEAVVLEKRPVAGAIRTCAVTREEAPRELLLRFVADPAGRLMEDLSGRLPGRAIYVMPSWPHVSTLLKRSGLLRGLRQGALLLPDATLLKERLANGLLQRWQDGIGLARRAGGLRKGVDELEEVVNRGGRPLVLLATDTALNTRQKLAGLQRKHGLEQPLELLVRDDFGQVCGMGPVAVLTIIPEGLAQRVRNDSQRWIAFFKSIH